MRGVMRHRKYLLPCEALRPLLICIGSRALGGPAPIPYLSDKKSEKKRHGLNERQMMRVQIFIKKSTLRSHRLPVWLARHVRARACPWGGAAGAARNGQGKQHMATDDTKPDGGRALGINVRVAPTAPPVFCARDASLAWRARTVVVDRYLWVAE